MELRVEYVPISELKPYANNAKLHPAEQVEQIKKSIEQFGMNDPIAIWKNNEIIEGHGRLIAATELGLEVVPVIRLDELTDEQRRAYALVHNKLTMNTGFDFSLLSEELKEIENLEMGDFGFGNFELLTDDDEIIPSEYDKEITSEYGEGETKSTAVYIVCQSEDDENWLKDLLNEDGDLKKIYYAEKLRGFGADDE